MDPPGSSVHGISWAKILEWVAISFSRGSCQPRDRTQVSCGAGDSLPVNHQESRFGFQGPLSHSISPLGKTQQMWEEDRRTGRPSSVEILPKRGPISPAGLYSIACTFTPESPTQDLTSVPPAVSQPKEVLLSGPGRSCSHIPCSHLTFRLVEIWSPNYSSKNSSTQQLPIVPPLCLFTLPLS